MNQTNINEKEIDERTQRLVNNEVLCNAGYAVESLIKNGLIEIDDISGLSCEYCNNCDKHADLCDCSEDESDWTDEDVEVMEWWVVTKYLYEKLNRAGLVTAEFEDLYFWGRTETGQALSMDSTLRYIAL